MAVTTPTRDRLRSLAARRPERGRVLSIFVDLDPSQFGTGEARASQLNSLLDEAAKAVDAGGLDHDALVQARADIDRVRSELDPQSLAAGGARGLAVYAAGDELFEVVPVPQALQRGIALAETPVVAPLATGAAADRLCVALASTGETRLFLGTGGGLEEVAGITDHIDKSVVDEERRDHFDTVARALLDRVGDYDVLLVGGPQHEHAAFIDRLHPDVRARFAGEVGIDIAAATAATVLEAAAPVLERRRAEREKELVDRLFAGGIMGREEVHAMLEQRRVETLLLVRGVEDPEAIAAAFEQDADVVVLPEVPELVERDGVGAILRF